MKRRTKPEDALESAAEGEKRLGLTAKTKRAAKRYAERVGGPLHRAATRIDFLAGAAWERRRRAKDGY